MFCYIIKQKQTNKDDLRATTAQLYPGRDTFEFDQESTNHSAHFVEWKSSYITTGLGLRFWSNYMEVQLITPATIPRVTHIQKWHRRSSDYFEQELKLFGLIPLLLFTWPPKWRQLIFFLVPWIKLWKYEMKRNVSFRISLRRPIYIVDSVDKTKLFLIIRPLKNLSETSL